MVLIACVCFVSCAKQNNDSSVEEGEQTYEETTDFFVFSNGEIKGVTGYGRTFSTLVIPSEINGENVISIGEDAFYCCDSLTSVEIPNSVTSIGDSAFSCCYNLKNITIGDSVTSIGNNAFEYCYSLTSVEIPNSVTSIGSDAFEYCYSLVEIVNKSPNITISKSSALAVFNNYDEYINMFTNIDGYIVYINGDKQILVNYIGSETKLTIPNGITEINQGAFCRNNNITSVKIPDSVTTIGKTAFYACHNLTHITLGKNVKKISGTKRFDGLYIDDAFDYCVKLVEIVNNSPYITLTKGSRDNGGIAVNALAVFNSGDEYINKFSTIKEDYLIYRENNETILVNYTGTDSEPVFPNEITKINANAFWNNIEIKSLIIPDSIIEIGDGAFWHCYGLNNVIVGDGVTTICRHAFRGCYNLTSVTIGKNVTSIGTDASNTWGINAFTDCYRLVEVINKSPHINIKKGENHSNGGVGYYARTIYNSGDMFIKTNLSTDKEGYVVLSEGKNKVLINYVGDKTNLLIPKEITEINQYAFALHYTLNTVKLGGNVCTIANDVFYFCLGLTNLTVPNSVTSIGSYAFEYCTSLTSIVIPNSVTSIGDSAFLHCSNLRNIKIGDSVTSIGRCAFGSCSSLTRIIISNKITNIGWRAFEYCDLLTIYCEVESQPKGWNSEWNIRCPVVWGYKGN